jgi:hypothetical protein
MRLALIPLLPLAVLAATPVPAQTGMKMSDAAPNCPADAEPIPPTLAGWTAPAQSVIAAAGATGVSKAMVTTGKRADVTLTPTASVIFAVAPEHPGATGTFGGLLALKVTAPGTYRVALSNGAWLDTVAAGKAVGSIAHGHGPKCSGMRKMVDFPLRPGDHLLQISGNQGAAISVLVAKIS